MTWVQRVASNSRGSGEPRGRPPAVRLGFRGWPPALEDLESLEDGLLLKSLGNPVGLRCSDTLDNAVNLRNKNKALEISFDRTALWIQIWSDTELFRKEELDMM